MGTMGKPGPWGTAPELDADTAPADATSRVPGSPPPIVDRPSSDPGAPSSSEPTMRMDRTPRSGHVPPAPRSGPSFGSTGSLPLPPPAEPLPGGLPIPPDGAVLGGIYRVVQPLGRGAMGVILLARDEHLQRPVAIKLLRPDQMGDLAMQDRLLEEARAMARVRHPNVVQIHAFGEYQGALETGEPAAAPYFVMEYVQGATLDVHARYRGGPPLEIDEALSILDQVCQGVSAIHAAGIAHRDLKPSNILVSAGQRVYVADLGLAREVGMDPTQDLSYSGTPAYIAPEVALRRKVDRALLPRCDVYAIGIIAYWLLSGRLPFEGRSAVELFKQHAHDRPRPPSEVNPDVPPSFDAPVLAALEKDPARRTETPERLRLALHKARQDGALSRNPTRVLVVDDSEEFRTLISAVLEDALPRAQIVAVEDGLTAIASIQQHPPSIAVIDLTLPDMDGIELTQAIRGLPAGGQFPIIVVTGTGGASEWQRLSALGAAAFLVKPIDAEQLTTLARRLLEGAPPRSAQRRDRP